MFLCTDSVTKCGAQEVFSREPILQLCKLRHCSSVLAGTSNTSFMARRARADTVICILNVFLVWSACAAVLLCFFLISPPDELNKSDWIALDLVRT